MNVGMRIVQSVCVKLLKFGDWELKRELEYSKYTLKLKDCHTTNISNRFGAISGM